jgi:hypothetical protein
LQRLASGQAWLRSSGPAELALRFVYLVIVDRGIAAAHQAVLVELPQLITVRSPPLPLSVVALILEPDRDAVIRKAPQVLLEPVVELPSPLALEESDYLLASLEELLAVARLISLSSLIENPYSILAASYLPRDAVDQRSLSCGAA